ncbi:histone-fold-containing protein [Clavulina sp. PMI_390]|nr:histone-fold-containing protein [Clavulina sp. PMI_390]
MAPATDAIPDHALEKFQATFWNKQTAVAEAEQPDPKHPALPLARIKKVMKSDPDVKMISADGPLLFSKACEIFISELTERAYMIAEAHKRRTITRSDIAQAAGQNDMFDFLIDFLPPEERVPTTKRLRNGSTSQAAPIGDDFTSLEGADGDEASPSASTSGGTSRRAPRGSRTARTNSTASAPPQSPATSIPTVGPSTPGGAYPGNGSLNSPVEARLYTPTDPPNPHQAPGANVYQPNAVPNALAHPHHSRTQSVPSGLIDHSEAILREAGSVETNVFFEQVRTLPVLDHDFVLTTLRCVHT